MEHRHLADRGAELVEIRADWLGRSPNVTRLLRERPTPIVFTCRRNEDRGRWRGTEEQRVALLRTAIVEGADYVDLEHDIAANIPRYGDTKRIVSYHDFDETPDDLEEIYGRLCESDSDIVKIVTMANTPSDSVRMLQLVDRAEVPTIGFCMGELGLFSRILCGKYGAPFTYASFSEERELAPGQIPFEVMKDVYRFDQIDRHSKIYGVLGDPIAHSLSPLIHNAAFAREGMNSVYLPFRVPEDCLLDTLGAFEWLDVRGYSVTIPHKTAVMAKAKQLDDAVVSIGAANTVVRQSSGDWRAFNTDYMAALKSIRNGLQARDGIPSLSGKKVLILGAGGAAKAIARAMVDSAALVTITNRTTDRAAALSQQLGCRHLPWEHRGTIFADILVNCTPVGMHPNVNETPFPENWLREGMLVFDTVYNPENTLLLKQAMQRECQTVSGVEMFIRQAVLQFDYFTGERTSKNGMYQTLKRGISAAKL